MAYKMPFHLLAHPIIIQGLVMAGHSHTLWSHAGLEISKGKAHQAVHWVVNDCHSCLNQAMAAHDLIMQCFLLNSGHMD